MSVCVSVAQGGARVDGQRPCRQQCWAGDDDSAETGWLWRMLPALPALLTPCRERKDSHQKMEGERERK